MKINWVIADRAKLKSHQVSQFRDVAPIWGSWRTWREFGTDNVICHDIAAAKTCLARGLPSRCNFFVCRDFYSDLSRPDSVQLYDGKFEHDTTSPEDIIALHLASQGTDIVLMYDFDLAFGDQIDRLSHHRTKNYLGMIRSIMTTNIDTQWVMIDGAGADASFLKLANFSRDNFTNVLTLATLPL